ncbi:hypothetical protein ACHAPU_007874 [Fusarium lateritium]
MWTNIVIPAPPRVSMSALASYADTSRAHWLRYTAQQEPAIEDKAFWGGLMSPVTTVMLPIEFLTRYVQPLKFPDQLVVRHKLHLRPFSKDSQILEMQAVVLSRRQSMEVAQIYEKLAFVDYSDSKRPQINPIELKPAMQILYEAQIQHEQDTLEMMDAFHERLDKLEEQVPKNVEDVMEDFVEESLVTAARSEYVARVRKVRENLRKEMASDHAGEEAEEEDQDDEDGMLNDLRKEMEVYENANQSK